MAVSSPAATVRLTPSSARTGGCPGYTFDTSSSSSTGASCVGAVPVARRCLDTAGHDAATTTRSPGVSAPLTCTSPELSSKSPGRHRHVAPRAARADDLDVVAAGRLGKQRRDRHRQHVAGALRGDVHRDRRLVQGARRPRVGRASPAPGSWCCPSCPCVVVATVPTADTTPGVVAPSGSVTRHRVTRLDLRLGGDIQADGHHVPVRGRRQHRAVRRAAQAAGHLADPERLRFEHHLP